MLRIACDATRASRTRSITLPSSFPSPSPCPSCSSFSSSSLLPPLRLASRLAQGSRSTSSSSSSSSSPASQTNLRPASSTRPPPATENAALTVPSCEHFSHPHDVDESSSSTLEPKLEPQRAQDASNAKLTEAQRNLLSRIIPKYRSTKRSSISARDSQLNLEQDTSPLEIFRWVNWLVEHSESTSRTTQSSYKGKEKESDQIRGIASSTSTAQYQHSASSWGLLLRHAARRSHGVAFGIIAQGFVRWWANEVSQQRFPEDGPARLDHGSPLRASGIAENSDHYPLLLPQYDITPRQVQQLALSLLTHLSHRQAIRKSDTQAIHRLLGVSSGSSDNTFVTVAKLQRPRPVPSSRSSRQAYRLQDGRRSFLQTAKKIAHLSSLKATSDIRRQIRDFMALLDAHQHGNLIDIDGMKRVLMEQGLPFAEGSLPEAMTSFTPSSNRRSHSRDLDALGEGELTRAKEIEEKARTAHLFADSGVPPPIAGILGSLNNRKSLASLIVQREQLLQQTILDWSSADDSGSLGGPSPSTSALPPAATASVPLWLFLAALRSLAERGNATKSKNLVQGYLSTWASQDSSLIEGRRRRYFLPARGVTSRMRKVAAVSDPDAEPEGASLLNLLIRSHAVGVIDAQSARRVYENVKIDLEDLCGKGGDERLLLDEHATSLKSETETVKSMRSSSPSPTSTPQSGLPLLVPDETTVLLCLQLLRWARAPLREAFDLVAEFERKWSPACAEDRLKRKEDASSTSMMKSKGSSPSFTSSDSVAGIDPNIPQDFTSNLCESEEQTPRLLLTLRTSRILLRWATDRFSPCYAVKAVALAEEWGYIARDVREVQARIRYQRAWVRKGRRVNKWIVPRHAEEEGERRQEGISFDASSCREQDEDQDEQEVSSRGKEVHIRHPRFVDQMRYSGMRHEGRQWALWRRNVSRSVRKGVLKPLQESDDLRSQGLHEDEDEDENEDEDEVEDEGGDEDEEEEEKGSPSNRGKHVRKLPTYQRGCG